MRAIKIICVLFLMNFVVQSFGSTTFDIIINSQEVSGSIKVLYGSVSNGQVVNGEGKFDKDNFHIKAKDYIKLQIEIGQEKVDIGSNSTIVTFKINDTEFSFFLRDVENRYPIYIPEYHVIILKNSNGDSYIDIERKVLKQRNFTKLQQIESENESSYSSVKDKVRDMSVPTWLGISRDARIFELNSGLEDDPRAEAQFIRPMFSSTPAKYSNNIEINASYLYALGRGAGVENNFKRRLENGVLPILNSTLIDDDVVYNTTSFVSLEKSNLLNNKKFGTSFWVADNFSGGHMFTANQKDKVDKELQDFYTENEEEKTILCSRTLIENHGVVPRYAFIKIPRPGSGWHNRVQYEFDGMNGLSSFSGDEVFCISKLNGKPIPNEELSVLLEPGETLEFVFYLPHTPISKERALLLSNREYNRTYSDSKYFWNKKLNNAAKISVPETRINEMIKAGLLHLDLITYGKEPNGTLAPCIGVYSPIGTESSPIIQFYASMGLNDIAKRSIDYFLDKQHDDGFIQNFGGYMVETGAALWTMGEYFRYTNDKDWVAENKDKFIKSCNYLIDWRNRNKKPDLKDKGYGMIDGKVADPEDPYHSFMLNGYGYLGVKRISEILREVDPSEAQRLKKESEEWRSDIRESFFNSMGNSPVIPLGDGTWSPTVPPWPEIIGPRALYEKNETYWSHGTFTGPDALLSPLYLVFCEVIDPKEEASTMMLDYHSELFYQGNSAFSQPYYSRHNWLQAKLGMVKPFLNTYYHTMAAHADRETYTFWEHMYRVSPHKTHEEAWFLMETRWMLYMEEGDTLSLLKTIPREWMEDEKEIILEGVKSYFGPINLNVDSHVKDGYIEATIKCDDITRKPTIVRLRIPHPKNMKPKNVIGGEYDSETETITISSFEGEKNVRVEF